MAPRGESDERKRNRLTEILVDEVSIVDRGANKRRYLVVKRGDGMKPNQDSLFETDLEDGDGVKKEDGDGVDKGGALTALEGAMAKLGEMITKLKEADGEGLTAEMASSLKSLGDLLGGAGDKYPSPSKAAHPDDEEEEDKEDKSMDLSKVPDALKPTLEKMAKRAEEVEKQSVALEKRNKELQVEIAKERDARLTREYTDLAKAEFQHLPGTADEVGAMLRDLSKAAPKEFEAVKKTLKAANEVVKNADMFSQAGLATKAEQTDAWQKMQAEAKKLVQKDGNGLTQEAAIEQVMKAQPDLYEQYLRETGVN